MNTNNIDPFSLTAPEIGSLLTSRVNLPELVETRKNPAPLNSAPQTQFVLSATEDIFDEISRVPQTSYTHYRLFAHTGDRARYEAAYFGKRRRMAGLALRLFLGLTHPSYGREALRDLLQDYLWSICEETTWVLPAHEWGGVIDLFSAETGFALAETLALLGDTLEQEVRHRVRQEIEQRILTSYLRNYSTQWWYQGRNNWNGVCNSSVASTFLWLEPELARTAHALELALTGIKTFLDTAFEADGSSTEGVAYWHYGLINMVAFSEMLRSRSDGRIDLLTSDRLRLIAAYPAAMQLARGRFVSFSDAAEEIAFNPGIIERLQLRTGEHSLDALLASPTVDWRLPMMLRNLLWWDGRQPGGFEPGDAVLPDAGVVKLVTRINRDNLILAIKAGNNDENHNHNDLGSFILNLGGETFLTDPGHGLYTRDYFNEKRYENVFANSYGHSVPRLTGTLQGTGKQFTSQLLGAKIGSSIKSARLELARAYPVDNLEHFYRTVTLSSNGATLEDELTFATSPQDVEEALMTWLPVEIREATAWLHGEHATLELSIEQPPGVSFHLESLEEVCKANNCQGILKRLTFAVPLGVSSHARVRITFHQRYNVHEC